MKPWPECKEAVIGCRTDDPYWKGSPDSKKSQCFQCNEAVWMSPVTIAHVQAKEETCAVVCAQCYRAYFDASGQTTVEIPPDTPEQVAEQGFKRSWEGTIFTEREGG